MVHKRSDDIATKKGEWGTPLPLFNVLNRMHGPFEIDLAASQENTKCEQYFDMEINSLECDWREYKRGFLNPDYSKGVLEPFMEKVVEETRRPGLRIVVLIPLAADTEWFQTYAMQAAHHHYISGRVRYVGKRKDGSIVKQTPSFPSCIAVFDKSLEEFGGLPRLMSTIRQKEGAE